MGNELLTAFLALGLITILPGPDVAVVTHAALTQGQTGARRAAAGITLGLTIWGVATVGGLAALLAESAAAYSAVKLIGAGYLIFLGVRTLIQLRGDVHQAIAHATPAPRGRGPFRRGLLTDLLNPKIAVFYVAVLPGLAPDALALSAGLALLVAMHVVITISWLTFYGTFVVRAGDAFRRPEIRRRMEALTGAVMVGLGIQIALTGRNG
ncbi:MAG: LysE family translocator [Solirubrobacteraceae bacterium]|nr:LysE family translocator [Solirubrobacteraceae bacterium]